MKCRQWVSAAVIALMVASIVMSVRSLWQWDRIRYAWVVPGPAADQRTSSTPEKVNAFKLFSVRGLVGFSVSIEQPGYLPTGRTYSLDCHSSDARLPSWPWSHFESEDNWSIVGLGRFKGNVASGFTLPYWLVVAVLSGALAWLFRSGRPERRRSRGLCPGCGYDIKAAPDAGCPECGWNRAADQPAM
jgi:hypothetical protein